MLSLGGFSRELGNHRFWACLRVERAFQISGCGWGFRVVRAPGVLHEGVTDCKGRFSCT